jgi:hypothetical protein
MNVLNRSTQLLLLCGAATALPHQAMAASFSTTAGYDFSATGAIGATGPGSQQIGTSFGNSQSFGGVSRVCDPTGITNLCGDYGADASVSTSGSLFLNVKSSFSGSQASLNYKGSAVTTLTELKGGHYAISLNAAPVAQGFSDTGATASFSINGGLGLSASASGRICGGGCTGGSATILNNNVNFNLLGASNAGKGSITIVGQPTPLVTLDKQQSLSFAGQGAPYLQFTLNSVGGTASGTTSASTTNSVFSANLDLIRYATSSLDLPSSFNVNMGSIGSVGYSIGGGGATVGVSLTRNDQANLSFNQVVSFVDRKTGQAVAVPIDYTTDSYIFNKDGRYRGFDDNGKPMSLSCTDGFSSADSISVTFLTGGTSSLSSPGPKTCFTHTTTNSTKAMTSMTGTSTSVAFQVGDGSFDFSKVKVVSKTVIGGQVSSQRVLDVSGGAYLSIGSGNVNISKLGGGSFGPLVSTKTTLPLATKDLGTQTVTFANTTVQNAIGFDGATNRQATVGLVGNGTTLVGGVSLPALALGNVRVGQIASGALTIGNTAANDGFSEGLVVSGAIAQGAARTAAAPKGTIAPGGTATLGVSVDTSRAGAQSGTVSLSAASDGSLTNGGTSVALGQQMAVVSANVYAPAVATVTPAVNFGIVRVGDAAQRSLSVTNSATGALTDSLVTVPEKVAAGFTLGAAPGALAQGQVGAISVTLDTSKAGSFSGKAGLSFVSKNPTLADLALDTQRVSLTGTVNNHAVAAFLSGGSVLSFDAALGGYVYDFGKVSSGHSLSLAGFAIENLVTGPADTLAGTITTGSPGSISLAKPITIGGLGAGGVSNTFGFTVDTTQAGAFTGELVFNGWGSNASDPIGEARQATLFLTGQVTAVPEPSRAWLFALGATCLLVLRRLRRRAA